MASERNKHLEDIMAAPVAVVAEEWAAPAPEAVCMAVPVPVAACTAVPDPEVSAECPITVIAPLPRLPCITADIIITVPITAATIIVPTMAADAVAAAFPYWLWPLQALPDWL